MEGETRMPIEPFADLQVFIGRVVVEDASMRMVLLDICSKDANLSLVISKAFGRAADVRSGSRASFSNALAPRSLYLR
jgi:D-Tyr-tRNAtyr deacylase